MLTTQIKFLPMTLNLPRLIMLLYHTISLFHTYNNNNINICIQSHTLKQTKQRHIQLIFLTLSNFFFKRNMSDSEKKTTEKTLIDIDTLNVVWVSCFFQVNIGIIGSQTF